MAITAEGIEWFRQRGISQQTLEQVPVASGTAYGKPAVYFKYRHGWKARTLEDKRFLAGGGFKSEFWGIEEVLAAKPDMVMLCEGEGDRIALVEAGIPSYQVLSVPNGAREKSSESGHEYLHNALAEGLGAIKRFVWCGDADDPGRVLRGDVLRIIGAARFWHVEWPEGIKDANEMLVKDGAQALHDLVMHGSLPWPQEGLYRLSDIPTPPPLTIWKTSIPDFDGRIHFAARSLSLVTGQPGHGKSTFFCQLWWDIATRYGINCCIASFETLPKPHIRRNIRTLISGKLEYDMTEQEKAAADAWINEHYVFVVHKEQRPTLEWFLDVAETAVVRHGAKVVQIDPWNRLEAMRAPKESETEYILRCLRALYVFAQDMDCHVQVVAHPAKMDNGRRNTPPMLEDVSGSKAWENIVDQGFTIHRPEMFDGTERKTITALYHRKARFEELGYPVKIMLNYDLNLRKYVPLSEGLTGKDFED